MMVLKRVDNLNYSLVFGKLLVGKNLHPKEIKVLGEAALLGHGLHLIALAGHLVLNLVTSTHMIRLELLHNLVLQDSRAEPLGSDDGGSSLFQLFVGREKELSVAFDQDYSHAKEALVGTLVVLSVVARHMDSVKVVLDVVLIRLGLLGEH